MFGFMSPALAGRIVDDMAAAENKEVYESALFNVAQAQRMRPMFLLRQPKAARTRMLLDSVKKPMFEEAAGVLIRGWLLEKQKDLLKTFLDALGVVHKEGVVEGDLPETIADDRLHAGVEALLAAHDREVVVVYLHAFHAMNGAKWDTLEQLLDKDARLQFS